MSNSGDGLGAKVLLHSDGFQEYRIFSEGRNELTIGFGENDVADGSSVAVGDETATGGGGNDDDAPCESCEPVLHLMDGGSGEVLRRSVAPLLAPAERPLPGEGLVESARRCWVDRACSMW